MVSNSINPETSVQAWLARVDEDCRAAKSLLQSGRYTWMAFACQQFLEKYLKAAYVQRFKNIPPYTHSLLRLCGELKLELPENILEILTTVDKYYLIARYPSYKESVNISNKRTADVFYKRVQEAYIWLKQTLNV